MSDKHSPTPYAVAHSHSAGLHTHMIRSPAAGATVATVADFDDATFIAAACNHHADLIRLVQCRVDQLRGMVLAEIHTADAAWLAEAADLVRRLKGGAA